MHAINYLFREAIFVTRDQVYKLAIRRKKKATAFIISQKISNGYSISLFNDLIVANKRRYTIDHVCSFYSSDVELASAHLEAFIWDRMLGPCCMDEQFLLIGAFVDEMGEVLKHASTFIKMECGSKKEGVVVHLDSNCDMPQSTNPKLLASFSAST